MQNRKIRATWLRDARACGTAGLEVGLPTFTLVARWLLKFIFKNTFLALKLDETSFDFLGNELYICRLHTIHLDFLAELVQPLNSRVFFAL